MACECMAACGADCTACLTGQCFGAVSVSEYGIEKFEVNARPSEGQSVWAASGRLHSQKHLAADMVCGRCPVCRIS